MKKITLNIPESSNLNEKDAKRFLAAKLYEVGKLSLGQAAEMAEMSKVAFAEILKDYEVSLINYPATEIAKDAAQF